MREGDGAARGMAYWYYGWKVYDVVEEVKVISTDLVNNTMTVDGGNWDTGVGDLGDTEVTYGLSLVLVLSSLLT